MTLRVSLARALMTVHGYTAEVDDEFRRALELASRPDAPIGRFPVLRALATYHLNISDYANTAAMGRQLLELAERDDSDAARVEGHLLVGIGLAFGGDLMTGLEHLDESVELFTPEMHGAETAAGNQPRGGGTHRLGPAALDGRLARSGRRRAASEAVEFARKLSHPYSLAYALYHLGFLDLNRREFSAARQCADELRTVAVETSTRSGKHSPRCSTASPSAGSDRRTTA